MRVDIAKEVFFIVWAILTLIGMFTDNTSLLLGVIAFHLLWIKDSVSK